MAYNNNYGGNNGGNNYGNRNNQGNQNRAGQINTTLRAQPPKAEPVPNDYVTAAEDAIKKCPKITRTKIRSVLTLANDIYNIENSRMDEKLLPESASKLKMMHIRLVYDAGRDNDVMDFVKNTKILNYVKNVEVTNSRTEFIKMSHYLEALVAYHRYYFKED